MSLCAVDWGVQGADEAALAAFLRQLPRRSASELTPEALRAGSFLVRHFRDPAAMDWLEEISRDLVVRSLGKLGPLWDVALASSAVAVAPISVEAALAFIDCSADRELREATRAASVARMEDVSALPSEILFQFFLAPHARSLHAARAWRAAAAAHRGGPDATGLAARSADVHSWVAQSEAGPRDTVAARGVYCVADPDLVDFVAHARYLWEHSGDDHALRGAVVHALTQGAGVLTSDTAPPQALARRLVEGVLSHREDPAAYGESASHVGLMAARVGLSSAAEEFLPDAAAALEGETDPAAQSAALQLNLALVNHEQLEQALHRLPSSRLLPILGNGVREGYDQGDVELLEFCLNAALPVLTDSAEHRAWVRGVHDAVWNVDWDPSCHLRSLWGEVGYVSE